MLGKGLIFNNQSRQLGNAVILLQLPCLSRSNATTVAVFVLEKIVRPKPPAKEKWQPSEDVQQKLVGE